MQFLCEFHRQQLQYHPGAATRRWQEWLEQGAERFRDADWPQATRFLGCAYEAGRLLSAQPHSFAEGDLTGFDRMMIAGHYLAECFGRMQQVRTERDILLTVHRDLMTALDDHAVARSIRARLRYNLAISLQLLDRHYRRQSDMTSFARLYHQTQARLQFCAGAVLH